MTVEERQKGVAIALAAAKAQGSSKPGSKKVASAKPTVKTPPPAVVAAAKEAPKPESKPAVAAAGKWRVQLGAFSSRGAAESLYKKLAAKGALIGRQPYYVPVGAITRLQAGPFESRAAASSACRSRRRSLR